MKTLVFGKIWNEIKRFNQYHRKYTPAAPANRRDKAKANRRAARGAIKLFLGK